MPVVPLAPDRNLTFPEADNINWKDLTYRSGFSYDLFGTGKTAVKFSFNKYLLGQTLNGLGRDPNPAIVAGAVAPTRTWNDIDRDFVPDCDLTVLTLNGECAQVNNLAFGSAVPTEQFDPDLITGSNHRHVPVIPVIDPQHHRTLTAPERSHLRIAENEPHPVDR